ncbi:MAG: hypothetical protein DDT34_02170 [Firmicutes bacterium]|nr:hypothetical protein [Bacillota bacterium]
MERVHRTDTQFLVVVRDAAKLAFELFSNAVGLCLIERYHSEGEVFSCIRTHPRLQLTDDDSSLCLTCPTGSIPFIFTSLCWYIQPNRRLAIRARQIMCEIACWPPRAELLLRIEALVEISADEATQQRVHAVLLVQSDAADDAVPFLQRF